jgi:hypothetical protein
LEFSRKGAKAPRRKEDESSQAIANSLPVPSFVLQVFVFIFLSAIFLSTIFFSSSLRLGALA